MSGFRGSLYVALALLICALTQACADKAEPDERLKQKVTLDCVNTRLHSAVEQIASETGVAINTGINQTDWKVRDVPILVCARDIPLGNLLKSFADATHLLWSGTKDDNDILKYRLWRDSEWQKQLDTFRKEKSAAQIAAANYDWDAIAKVKNLSEAELEGRYAAGKGDPDGEATQLWAKKCRAISNVVAGLDQQTRNKILNGQPLVLSCSAASDSIKPYVTDALRMYLTSSDAADARDGRPAKAGSIDERLKGCWLTISYDDPIGWALNGSGSLTCQICCPGTISTMEGMDFIAALGKKARELPERPRIPEARFDTDKLDSRYVELDLSQTGGPAFLDKSIKIKKPNEKKQPTYQDLLRGLSEEIGYSIIAEGRAARNVSPMLKEDRDSLPMMFGRNITARQILKFSRCAPDFQEWYVDESRKVIIGRNRDWLARLDSLVPEKLIVNLQKKLKGNGIDIDDVEPLVALTKEQVDDWIHRCPEVPELETLHVAPSGTSLLELYFSLGPRERALVKSGKSVSIAAVDPGTAKALLSKMITDDTRRAMIVGYPDTLLDKRWAGFVEQMQALERDDFLATVKLRLKKMPAGQDQHQYVFFLESQDQGGAKFAYSAGFFPIREQQPSKDKPDAK